MERKYDNCKINKPKIIKVEESLNSELLSYFKGEKEGYVQVGSKKWFYPMKYKKLAEAYWNFQVRPDDVWITGVPRSGTTVTQELVWLLTHNLDFDAAKELADERVRFFESDMVVNDETRREYIDANADNPNLLVAVEKMKKTLQLLNESTNRRVIKTHLPFELLPRDIFDKGCKVIYVCRHPKDVAVSYYFLQREAWHIKYTGDFPKYWNFFQNGNCMFGPYFEHVKQGYQNWQRKNFLFVFYEDLRKDLKGYIEKFSKFLERPLNEDEFKKLESYLEFENFKKNRAILDDKSKGKVEFVRKGKVGGWREYFTEEMSREADEWIEKHTEEIGLKYPDRA